MNKKSQFLLYNIKEPDIFVKKISVERDCRVIIGFTYFIKRYMKM